MISWPVMTIFSDNLNKEDRWNVRTHILWKLMNIVVNSQISILKFDGWKNNHIKIGSLERKVDMIIGIKPLWMILMVYLLWTCQAGGHVTFDQSGLFSFFKFLCPRLAGVWKTGRSTYHRLHASAFNQSRETRENECWSLVIFSVNFSNGHRYSLI